MYSVLYIHSKLYFDVYCHVHLQEKNNQKNNVHLIKLIKGENGSLILADSTIKQDLTGSYVTTATVSTDTPPGLFMQHVTAQYPVSDRQGFVQGLNLSEPRSLTYLTAPPHTHTTFNPLSVGY